MPIFQINDDNKIPIWLLGISIFVAIVIVVWFFNNPIYKPLVYASGLYAFLGVICMGFLTNGSMQDYFIGIPKNWKTFLWIGVGLGAGFLFLQLSRIGLSMGVPLIPQSIATNLRAIVIVFFAPVVEDILRFSLLGFILYLTRRCSKSSCGIDKKFIWLAIIIQAIFFVILHFASYATGFYEAPTFLGALTGLSAVSASLISAGIFAVFTGWLVSLDGVKNIVLSIAMHLAVNLLLFSSLAIVGLNLV